MTRDNSFLRKVAYLGLIALLFIPISQISAPATSPEEGGGTLTKMRAENRLSQAQLGKIDPASASMSLATLGMRGVAANLLWGQAIHYKKTENWDAFMAALNQITKLQPNFVSVWQYQSWNISYNVSVEFDDFRHRYHWVKKGVNYLTEGIEYNEEEPLLLSDLGWFFGHKLGRADEYRQFRRLFRGDDDFHEELPVPTEDVLGPDEKPDNWLVANYWFARAQQAVDRGAQLKRLSTYYWAGDKAVVDKKQTPLRGKNPLVFHSEPAKALINFANAIEEEGYLDEKGQIAWRNAEKAWREYGDRDIMSSWGIVIHLNDQERAEREATEADKELADLTPGLRKRLREEKIAKLLPAEQNVLKVAKNQLASEQLVLRRELETKVEVTPVDLANAVGDQLKTRVQRLAVRIALNLQLTDIIRRYREIVNFKYWLDRCIAEQEENTIQARRLVLQAGQAFDKSDLPGAREKYEQAWDKWAVVFDRYPLLVDDVEGEDVMVAVQEYQRLLGQLDLPFPPPNFKLRKLLDAYIGDYEFESVTKAVEAADAAAAAAPPTTSLPSSDSAVEETDVDATTPSDEKTDLDTSPIDVEPTAQDAAQGKQADGVDDDAGNEGDEIPSESSDTPMTEDPPAKDPPATDETPAVENKESQEPTQDLPKSSEESESGQAAPVEQAPGDADPPAEPAEEATGDDGK